MKNLFFGKSSLLFVLLTIFFFCSDLQAQSKDGILTPTIGQIVTLESNMDPSEIPAPLPVDKPFENYNGIEDIVDAQAAWMKDHPTEGQAYVEALLAALSAVGYDSNTMTPDQQQLYMLYKGDYKYCNEALNGN